MTKSFEKAIRDLTSLTLADDLEWVQRAENGMLDSDDLVGFSVHLVLANGEVELSIEDETGVVARVGQGDQRATAERAALQGAAFELLLLARTKAGSEASAKWSNAVIKRRS